MSIMRPRRWTSLPARVRSKPSQSARDRPTTKIHALTDDIGPPLAFLITPGNTHDLVAARGFIGVVRSPPRLLADRA
ncbi:transposase [Bradyrhizobium sp. BWC-3-1]|uniref:transposase n=1 Tax=Bradyrhizobium sp. BWC-3-1 TaxID=3080012 RepID=UPI00293E5287|nr:transposase [Bradyrhizobium sp. BWC-3-1]WOH57280.1 transposase [Bradyrhizobium sp. BWC-3-1]